MPTKRNQSGSGNPGTYYQGFGQFYAKYPHVLLGGAKPSSYDGYGLHAAEYPGASRYLTSPSFKHENVMGAYPGVFGGPFLSGGARCGNREVEDIVRATSEYMRSKNRTWSGLASNLREPGLEVYMRRSSYGNRIELTEPEVHLMLGRYWAHNRE